MRELSTLSSNERVIYLVVAGLGEELSLDDVTEVDGDRIAGTVARHRVPL